MPSLSKTKFSSALPLIFLATLSCTSGGDADSGSLELLVEPEDTITSGIRAGSGLENIRDGWDVDFSKYLVAMGHVELRLSADQAVEADAADIFVVDLTQLPASGEILWTFDELETGTWEVYYGTLGAGDGATRHATADPDDFELMVEDDLTYLIQGTISNSSGHSCPPASLATTGAREPNGEVSGGNPCFDAPTIDFTFGLSAETIFGPCEVDGIPGVAIGTGTDTTAALTIHGDHLFFNGFPEGDEGGILRLAQWLADCDLDLDGMVTEEELLQISPTDLPELDDRYQLGGSPITPLESMRDYVAAQLKTQGHFQGEGECPVDGVEHDHAHEDDHDDHDDHDDE